MVSPMRVSPPLLVLAFAWGCSPSPRRTAAPQPSPPVAGDPAPSSDVADAAATSTPEATAAATPEPAAAEAEPEPAPDPLARPDDATMATFRAGGQDAYIQTEKHYVKTNETRHDVWFEYIDGLGGAYVGVGADQNYTLIGRARPTFVFLIDIDRRVNETHWIYEALIEANESPEALLAHFEKGAEQDTVALLEAHYAALPEDERRRIVRAYKASRETLRRHLARVATRTRDGAPSSWLSDAQSYAWIRRLYLADRVRIMAGDLTGSTTMQTIGRVLGELHVPMRLLYLSNAEEYFKYHTGAYRENVRGLNGDAESVVLRTLYGPKWTHADSLWNYQVQPWQDFADRLARPEIRSRNPMIADAEKNGEFERDAGAKGRSLIASPRARAPRE